MRVRWERVGIQEVAGYLALAMLTGVCAQLLTQLALRPPAADDWALHYAPDRHAHLGAPPTRDLIGLLSPPAQPASPPAAASPTVVLSAASSEAAPTVATAAQPGSSPHAAVMTSSGGHGALPERAVPQVRARVDLASVRFVPRRPSERRRTNISPPETPAAVDGAEALPALVDTTAQPLSIPSPDESASGWRTVREALSRGRLPDPSSVRAEDLVNAQASDVRAPADGSPVAVDVEAVPHPWHPGRHLLRVGLRAEPAPTVALGPAHLVLVVDTSGSMALDGRLDHVKAALHGLVTQLGEKDRISLVAYADRGTEHVASAGPDQAAALHLAIEGLRADGASAQAEGLRSGWQAAQAGWSPGTDQRLVLFTDGEANLDLAQLDPVADEAAAWAARGLRLDVVAIGLGDEADARAAALAARGGGRLWSIDGFGDAEVLASELRGAPVPAARAVDIAVAFQAEAVEGWRLVGHDGAGSGAVAPVRLRPGQVITALYELALVPLVVGQDLDQSLAEIRLSTDLGGAAPLSWVVDVPARVVRSTFEAATRDMRVSLAAARFGELLLRPSVAFEPWAAAAALAAPDHGRVRPQDQELARLIRQSGRLAARGLLPGEAGAPVRLDRRDDDLLARRLLRAQGTVEPCATAHLATGALALTLVVEGGAVVSAEVAHDGGDSGLERCVAEVATSWRFPTAWSAELAVPVELARR